MSPPTEKLRCPYRYYDNLTGNFNFGDNQCTFEEGHIGEHIKREILPSPQPSVRLQGWMKP